MKTKFDKTGNVITRKSMNLTVSDEKLVKELKDMHVPAQDIVKYLIVDCGFENPKGRPLNKTSLCDLSYLGDFIKSIGVELSTSSLDEYILHIEF